MEIPSQYERLRVEAEQASENSDYDLSFELYAQALELMPDSPEALKNMGRAYLDKGNDEEAEWYCRKAIEIDPTYWRAFNNLGNILKRREEWPEAIAMLEKAIALCPDESFCLVNLGNLYCKKGNCKKAQYYYNKALSINPSDWEAQYNQAHCFLEMGKCERALFLFEKLIDKTKNRYLCEVYACIAKCHYGLGDYEKSIQVRYQVMEHLKPEYHYYQYQQIAKVYETMGQPDLAFYNCLKAAENQAKDADGFDFLNRLGYELFKFHKDTRIRKKGIQYFLENAFANPESDIAHYHCAAAFNRFGDYKKAAIYAEKAISLSPHPRNYFQLANAYRGQDNAASSLKVLKKMLDIDPSDFYEAHEAMAMVYREQGKEKLAAKMESRLEALKKHRESLDIPQSFIHKGEITYTLFWKGGF